MESRSLDDDTNAEDNDRYDAITVRSLHKSKCCIEHTKHDSVLPGQLVRQISGDKYAHPGTELKDSNEPSFLAGVGHGRPHVVVEVGHANKSSGASADLAASATHLSTPENTPYKV